jgi:hypothetical protein
VPKIAVDRHPRWPDILLAVVFLTAGRARLTRNGDVDVVDFLEVIGAWGPCE